jgi:Holliday junction resolvase RusA-like endonuclease
MSRKPRRPTIPAAPVELAEAGTVIAEGVVPGRAIPWKSPRIGRNGGTVPTRDYSRYQAWQVEIQAAALLARSRRCPYGGAVHLIAEYYLRPNGRTVPDLDNLDKAFSDAIQGVLIINDVQVCSKSSRRVLTATEPERVEWRIVAVNTQPERQAS